MSGLLSLLDDVAAIAKLAASQIDDVAAHAAKAGAKAAGVVIDDAAVTPKYVHGLPAAREIPIVLQIARGSLFNKIVILLPAALLLNALFPWALTPLLMLGGAYLCFEGAEKVVHLVRPHDAHAAEQVSLDAAHLERERVSGAIKTDFILSAEIMAIALATIETDSIWQEAAVLALVAVVITVLVYGSVAILVKADDVGLRLGQTGRWGWSRALGRGIVKGMPTVLSTISAIGMAAMLWVGGSIVVHGLDVLGWTAPDRAFYDLAAAAANAVPGAGAVVAWTVRAALDGVFGLALGLAIIPLATRVLIPLFRSVRPG